MKLHRQELLVGLKSLEKRRKDKNAKKLERREEVKRKIQGGKKCSNCDSLFTLSKKPFSCRNCCEDVCSGCSKTRFTSFLLPFKCARICDKCTPIVKGKEEQKTPKHIQSHTIVALNVQQDPKKEEEPVKGETKEEVKESRREGVEERMKEGESPTKAASLVIAVEVKGKKVKEPKVKEPKVKSPRKKKDKGKEKCRVCSEQFSFSLKPKECEHCKDKVCKKCLVEVKHESFGKKSKKVCFGCSTTFRLNIFLSGGEEKLKSPREEKTKTPREEEAKTPREEKSPREEEAREEKSPREEKAREEKNTNENSSREEDTQTKEDSQKSPPATLTRVGSSSDSLVITHTVPTDSNVAESKVALIPSLELICSKCGKEVTNGGVKAMTKIWHQECFVCTTCKQPFDEDGYYNVGGSPYCKPHAIERKKKDSGGLINCSKCGQEVTSGGVKAMQQIWHQECFVCTTCKKPFDKDGYYNVEGSPYCKKDATEANKLAKKRKEAASASVPEKTTPPASPSRTTPPPTTDTTTPALPTSTEATATPSVSSATTTTPQPKQELICERCAKEVVSGGVKAMSKIWHHKCFVCTTCKQPFDKDGYYNVDGNPFCKPHAIERKRELNKAATTPRASPLPSPSGTTPRDTSPSGTTPRDTSPSGTTPRDTSPSVTTSRTSSGATPRASSKSEPNCSKCGKEVTTLGVKAMEQIWHQECFVCTTCKQPFDKDGYYNVDGSPFCKPHAIERKRELQSQQSTPSPPSICPTCNLEVKVGVSAMNKKWHGECLKCTMCDKKLKDKPLFESEGKAYCKKCIKKKK